MRKLFIIGAGGFGRETLDWALTQQTVHPGWKVAGFLDANPQALDGFNCTYPIVGDPLAFAPSSHDCFVCAVGDPATRLNLCDAIQGRGGQFVSIIHPTALIGRDSRLGQGCIVCPGVIVSTNATVGNFVVLNMNCTVGHDAVVGDGCTLSCHTDITGAVMLGKGVLVGSHASVLPHLKVGDFAVVAAGSVAYRDVTARTTVIGVPARCLLRRDGKLETT